MFTMSTRDRLILAFAELDAYGVATTHGAHGRPELTRSAMQLLLRSRYPNGSAAYVFWSLADEDNFDADGMLRAELPLYTSGPAEDAAVLAALAHQRVEVVRRPDGVLAVPATRRESVALPPQLPGS